MYSETTRMLLKAKTMELEGFLVLFIMNFTLLLSQLKVNLIFDFICKKTKMLDVCGISCNPRICIYYVVGITATSYSWWKDACHC
jgi:hypothetical protein